MVVRTIHPDDWPIRKGRYVTILASGPEPVMNGMQPVIAPGMEGYEPLMAVNTRRYGQPLLVVACEYPFIVCELIGDCAGDTAGQRLKIDARRTQLAYVSPKYAKAFKPCPRMRKQLLQHTQEVSTLFGPPWTEAPGDNNE